MLATLSPRSRTHPQSILFCNDGSLVLSGHILHLAADGSADLCPVVL